MKSNVFLLNQCFSRIKLHAKKSDRLLQGTKQRVLGTQWRLLTAIRSLTILLNLNHYFMLKLNCMYLPNPSTTIKMGHSQFFKWNTAGLNLEFFFSYIGCLSKTKEPSLSDYLPITGRSGFMPFFKWNTNSLTKGLNMDYRFHFQ